jgi:N-acetyltransferase
MNCITWESCGRATFEKRFRPALRESKPVSVPISKPGPVLTHSRKLSSERSFYSLKDAEKGNNRVITIYPVNLEGLGIRLEPLAHGHHDELATAAADGKLWELWFTAVPEPERTEAYIRTALAGQQEGHMLPWAVRELTTGQVIGSTRYHDIAPAIDRVEIGYTWYARRWQRSHVNTACKLLLLAHAFDTLGCKVVGLRTDNFNLASQRAIEALGAKKDGVIRHHMPRRDGTARDTVFYSILAGEWYDVKRHLELRLARHGAPPA